ncbi:hypothetical protein AAZX31_07G057700 [Glycine max]|uniref:DUF2996 domain-containing protein n=2 Tax=Glycine subgen. Soja TaxID=1462606 RepID=I1KHZ1_SOYBN|nr:uncharacterized protein LOC100305492 [Glycine max]XP_028239438.1 uncharacterized protein LOC114418342 isoform X1 [Glycine soja]KAG5009105.1 hypothetical protein JHK87_017620 [Glycine soja]KAG5141981.1 hypothetical protein JHK82_017676 [Glycine max]KAH1085637.1 hypothetical protein GYH30_017549 [Glycine max]KAH1240802.1 hypothetical protein GmHk_07G018570 [Glycine max]KHN27255.1 hypothetical protein glysoja_041813 [Glycine soja]|eukprot:NP_001236171.2 uncharacterized protein LOC100305492 [Glycine max]
MQMAILLRGGALGDSSFRLCSLTSTSSLHVSQNVAIPTSSSSSSSLVLPLIASKFKTVSRIRITCSAVQESSPSTAATAETKEEVKEAPKAEPAKKPPAKAPAKPLPQMMEEDVIPSLKSIFEAQEDFSNIELVFKDNKLEGSFLKKGNPYSFWAFFPTGNLIGPKGFSLSSYNSGASTVEPFLIDEKKITARHIIFWVKKRLAAQGIIPVWED